MRASEACPPVAPAVVGGGGVGGVGVGPELDSAGGERLPGAVSGCLDGEYSPQSVASADSDKKSSNKRKRDVTGESRHTGTDGSQMSVLGCGRRRASKKVITRVLQKEIIQ